MPDASRWHWDGYSDRHWCSAAIHRQAVVLTISHLWWWQVLQVQVLRRNANSGVLCWQGSVFCGNNYYCNASTRCVQMCKQCCVHILWLLCWQGAMCRGGIELLAPCHWQQEVPRSTSAYKSHLISLNCSLKAKGIHCKVVWCWSKLRKDSAESWRYLMELGGSFHIVLVRLCWSNI